MSSIEARTAARWWADVIRNGAKFDNGDSSFSGLMTKALAETLKDVSEENLLDNQIQVFETTIAQIIDGYRINSTGDLPYPLIVSVDYHPDWILSRACEVSKVSENLLPWKTVMWIKNGSVSVSYGYRAPTENIPLSE